MAWTESVREGVAILAAEGRIDLSNADALTEALGAALAGADLGLVVDMGGVAYISSAGLRSLLITSRGAKSAGKQFAVAAVPSIVAEVLAISGFSRVFPVFPTVRDAVEALMPAALPGFGQE